MKLLYYSIASNDNYIKVNKVGYSSVNPTRCIATTV